MPEQIILTFADFASNRIAQLKKYEGMRVTVAEMTIVAPTKDRVDGKTASSVSNGGFYSVLK